MRMYDYLRREIFISDRVVLVQPGYRNFVDGTVVRFTECFVMVEYTTGLNYTTIIKQKPEQLIKR